MTLAFPCEVVHKNYENPSIFVKVTAKKPVAPFFSWTRCILEIKGVLTLILGAQSMLPVEEIAPLTVTYCFLL